MIVLILAIVFRWMHILAAVVAVGGLFFARFVLMPSASEALSDEQHQALRGRILGRWKIVVMVCITLLLVSGLYNFMILSIPKGREAPVYHPLFGVKILLALAVFFLASVLTGRSKLADAMRRDVRRWMGLTFGLALLVILISGVLKNL